MLYTVKNFDKLLAVRIHLGNGYPHTHFLLSHTPQTGTHKVTAMIGLQRRSFMY